jgi:arylsulfatase A-like enzyme
MGLEAGEGELSGQSLMPDVEGQGPHDERDVYVDMPIGPFNGTRRALITGPTPGTKVINLGGSQYQLFDLASDPGELKDLAKDKEKLEPMKAAMQAYRARLREIEVKPAEN